MKSIAGNQHNLGKFERVSLLTWWSVEGIVVYQGLSSSEISSWMLITPSFDAIGQLQKLGICKFVFYCNFDPLFCVQSVNIFLVNIKTAQNEPIAYRAMRQIQFHTAMRAGF